MPKLLGIVLAILVLVLVLLFNNEAYAPLKDKLVASYDEVLVLMNIRQGNLTASCREIALVDFGESGYKLMDELGITGDARNLVIYFTCTDGRCGLNFSSETKFDRRSNFIWGDYLMNSVGALLMDRKVQITNFKNDKEIYETLYDEVHSLAEGYYSAQGREYSKMNFYEDLNREEDVVLYIGVLEDEDDNEGAFYRWDGSWSYKSGAIDDGREYSRQNWDNDEAFDRMVGASQDYLDGDDEVYYWRSETGYRLVPKGLGSDRELEKSEKVDFASWFENQINGMRSDSKFSMKLREGFSEYVSGKSVLINGVDESLFFDKASSVFYYDDVEGFVGIVPKSSLGSYWSMVKSNREAKVSLEYEPLDRGEFIIPKSIAETDLNKGEEAYWSEEGFCIGYYALTYLNKMDKSNTLSNEVILELSKYSWLEPGYFDRVHEDFQDAILEAGYEDFQTDRKYCAAKASGFRSEIAGEFYTEPFGDLADGFADDEGYCLKFPSSHHNWIADKTTREVCYQEYLGIIERDPGFNTMSFVVTKRGSKELEKNPESQFLFHYSPDFFSNEVEEDLTEGEIKEVCSKWEGYELTFVTGAIKKGVYTPSSDACKIENNRLRNSNRLRAQYSADILLRLRDVELFEPVGNDKDLCCYYGALNSAKDLSKNSDSAVKFSFSYSWDSYIDLGRFMNDYDTLLKLIKIYEFLDKRCG